MTTETKTAEKPAETKLEERKETQPPARTETPAAPALRDTQRGIQLVTIDDYLRFAEYLCRGKLAPKGMESPEACMIALQLGAEVGLPPMAAVQNICVINGRPSIWGDAFLAVLRSSPNWVEEDFNEWVFEDEEHGLVAACTMRRKGGKPKTTYFTQRMAERAGLWSKEGPWQDYPERMCQMRARAWRGRDTFADVIKGLSIAEEIIDVEFEEVRDERRPIEQPRASDLPALPPIASGGARASRPKGGGNGNGNGNGGPRRMKAKYASKCGTCGEDVFEGEPIVYDGAERKAHHENCWPEG